MNKTSIQSNVSMLPPVTRSTQLNLSHASEKILRHRSSIPNNSIYPIEISSPFKHKKRLFLIQNDIHKNVISHRAIPSFVDIYRKPLYRKVNTERNYKQSNDHNPKCTYKRMSMIVAPLKYSQANLPEHDAYRININQIKK